MKNNIIKKTVTKNNLSSGIIVDNLWKYWQLQSQDKYISTFINCFLKRGKKYQSFKLFQNLLKIIKDKIMLPPVFVLQSALLNYKNIIRIRTIQFKKKKFYKFTILDSDRQVHASIKYLSKRFNSYQDRSENDLVECLAIFILNLFFKTPIVYGSFLKDSLAIKKNLSKFTRKKKKKFTHGKKNKNTFNKFSQMRKPLKGKKTLNRRYYGLKYFYHYQKRKHIRDLIKIKSSVSRHNKLRGHLSWDDSFLDYVSFSSKKYLDFVQNKQQVNNNLLRVYFYICFSKYYRLLEKVFSFILRLYWNPVLISSVAKLSKKKRLRGKTSPLFNELSEQIPQNYDDSRRIKVGFFTHSLKFLQKVYYLQINRVCYEASPFFVKEDFITDSNILIRKFRSSSDKISLSASVKNVHNNDQVIDPTLKKYFTNIDSVQSYLDKSKLYWNEHFFPFYKKKTRNARFRVYLRIKLLALLKRLFKRLFYTIIFSIKRNLLSKVVKTSIVQSSHNRGRGSPRRYVNVFRYIK